MQKVVRTIRVTDGNGDELTLFEYPRRRFVLDTGEIAKRIDEETFELPSGERLMRVR